MHTPDAPLRTTSTSIKRLSWIAVATVAVSVAVYLWQSARNPWEVQPEEVAWTIEFSPLDAVTAIDGLSATDQMRWESIRAAFGPFATLYFEDILQIGPADSDTLLAAVAAFAQHPDIAATFAAIDTTSATAIPAATRDLENAFRRFHAHFPAEPIPQVVWLNSAFNYAIYPTPEYLGIGLDWFLGADHPIVGQLAPAVFPNYLRTRMSPEFLVADALRGWLLVHFSQQYQRSEVCADELLFWGKILFIAAQLAPEVEERLWLDWTPEQWTWALENERAVWLEIQPQSVLFERDFGRYNRWFAEGPFTRAGNIPQSSPDRLGAWMGWQMVSDYMEKNKEVSLQDLLEMTDPTAVLKAYRPDR